MKPKNTQETQEEYIAMLDYWFQQTTGKTLEQEAESLEVTVDYLIEEFI